MADPFARTWSDVEYRRNLTLLYIGQNPKGITRTKLKAAGLEQDVNVLMKEGFITCIRHHGNKKYIPTDQGVCSIDFAMYHAQIEHSATNGWRAMYPKDVDFAARPGSID